MGKVRQKPKFPIAPLKCEVWVLNDDDTSAEYVVYVLQKVFRKSMQEAQQITMLAGGSDDGAKVGTYWKDVALTRLRIVEDLNREHDERLQFRVVEPEE